jgi:putative transposase
MDDHYKTPLISRVIRMAARNIELAEGAVFRSDRVGNYASSEFAKVLGKLGTKQSAYATRKSAVDDIARWIELRYKMTRLHSTLVCRTPQEVLDEYLNGQEAA